MTNAKDEYDVGDRIILGEESPTMAEKMILNQIGTVERNYLYGQYYLKIATEEREKFIRCPFVRQNIDGLECYEHIYYRGYPIMACKTNDESGKIIGNQEINLFNICMAIRDDTNLNRDQIKKQIMSVQRDYAESRKKTAIQLIQNDVFIDEEKYKENEKTIKEVETYYNEAIRIYNENTTNMPFVEEVYLPSSDNSNVDVAVPETVQIKIAAIINTKLEKLKREEGIFNDYKKTALKIVYLEKLYNEVGAAVILPKNN